MSRKKLGDFMQRMNDYSRVQNFLTGQVVSILFSVVNLVVFCSVLWWYNSLIFGVYMAGSLLYTLWALYFLKSRRTIDYELFELQAISQNKTYQFFSSMQEIKLQDCENRRRWEWEDVQADFFKVQMKSLKLSQTQSIGGLLINEIKNIFITVLSATIVINGNITLGSMLAIQFIVGQLNIPVSQIIDFIYSLQDVKLSLERMNDVYQLQDENNKNGIRDFKIEKGIDIENIFFKYRSHLN